MLGALRNADIPESDALGVWTITGSHKKERGDIEFFLPKPDEFDSSMDILVFSSIEIYKNASKQLAAKINTDNGIFDVILYGMYGMRNTIITKEDGAPARAIPQSTIMLHFERDVRLTGMDLIDPGNVTFDITWTFSRYQKETHRENPRITSGNWPYERYTLNAIRRA